MCIQEDGMCSLLCGTLGNSSVALSETQKKKIDIQNNFTNQVCAMASVCSNVNIGTLYCCFSGPRCDKVERSASRTSNKARDVQWN